MEERRGQSAQGGEELAARDVAPRDDAELAAELCVAALQEPLEVRDQLAKIAESVPGVICSYRLRPDGSASFPFAMGLAEETWGIRPELLARDAAPLFARIHPDDLGRVTAVIAEAARTVARWHDVFRYVHPTKGVRWFEGWSVPKPEPDGSILWHGFVMDVTERKLADEAVRESERKYRTLYTSTPVMMHSIDREGRLLSVSDHWLETMGYTREEVIGRPSVDFLTPESRRYATEVVLPAYFATGSCKDVPYRVVKKDGEVIDVLLSAIAERDAEGRFVRSLAVIVDVTRRKQAEEALRDSDRRKSEFLAMLSHELRNPLAPIRNGIYLLDRAPPGSEQAARAKEIIRRQTEHLTRLVDDLLDVTRISRGKVMLARERIDARGVVRQTCEDHRALFAHRGIELRLELGDPVWIDADPTRVGQIVSNLLQNAAKFTPDGGGASVTVAAVEGWAEIRVLDSGIGIDPRLLERMFEPFAQAERSLARTQGGLGLGLALVKGMVELHGGTVTARSDGPDRGTELVVRLPLVSAPELGARSAAPAPDARALDILVVEDNADAAQTLVDVLELSGHHVRVAHDGRSGIAMALERRPEVVLCDIGLPDVSGYDVARALRGRPELRGTRLVALSGYAQPEDRQRAAEAGFHAHLGKPAPLEALDELLAGAT